MLYQISHSTTYTYSDPVILQPHLIRLRPRSDGWQSLKLFSMQVMPIPIAQSELSDLDGNTLIKVWFSPELTGSLTVQIVSQTQTHQANPFNYLLEPWAMSLPIDYPTSLFKQLQPYLGATDAIALQLAYEIAERSSNQVTQFLYELTQQIYTNCEYVIRETGNPYPPGLTWTQKKGSCRDLTVLFIEVCRSIGLAARFVSGYQEGDEDHPDRHLHAWAEVYLPGAGWRGYDPTHGLAVSDRHIAVAASAIPEYAAPIVGKVTRSGGVQSTMDYTLQIQRIADLM
ncbi:MULTISPECIES: transglutaminase family protein [Leptolyngbya]|uniref:Transglutaminase domain protein n=2 Tax=Leptolyngbya boryana TaxID=1184 RepID=A0A1Z4JCT0_LEPBY|nr:MULTISPECIES: transglutaminase family protein [Leptolyngbya]MBD2365534.1 transglutaminase family protein [Leptolyngbya sp. FACHB-161]MBD2371714.1 transglutaminase family protein [Leptolyngbya sp. FACHB-238]MBD2396139.1 transglutaminase family protein [Leptolyngbya sp. FACHB-239]MBD2402662.1 transglutaminase family protein [Leptolyngbya sp. FACHB-402]BAY54541.1 transglutaminase domain protein [Leptolyngbya boryana NIES-2135]